MVQHGLAFMRRAKQRVPFFLVFAILVLVTWTQIYVENVDLNPRIEGPLVLDHTPNSAWATMVTDDQYVLGAIVTVQSILDTKSKVKKIICMVTAKVSGQAQKLLRLSGCTVRWVSSIASPNGKGSNRYNDTYTKLNVWDLTEFVVVLYLDADVLVLKNMDELFQLHLPGGKHVAAARDCCDMWNPGVMVLRPDANVFHDMLRKMEKLPSWDGGDGGFLNSYFGDHCTYLSFRYNADQIVLSLPRNRRAWRLEDLTVIHFAGPKPWDHLTTNTTGTLEPAAGARTAEVAGLAPGLFHELHVLWEHRFRHLEQTRPDILAAYHETLAR